MKIVSVCRLGFLIARILAKENAGNYVVSPFSISQALTSVYAGAEGDTAAAMKAGLYLGDNTDEFHDKYGALSEMLMTRSMQSPKQTLKISNAICCRKVTRLPMILRIAVKCPTKCRREW